MVLAENPSNILDKNYTIFCAATTCNNYLTITIAQVNYFTKKYKKKIKKQLHEKSKIKKKTSFEPQNSSRINELMNK